MKGREEYNEAVYLMGDEKTISDMGNENGNVWCVERILRLLVLAIALLFVFGVAQSQEITKGQPSKQNYPGNTNQKRTVQPSIIVNVTQPLKTEEEKSEEQRDRELKAISDNKLIEFTGKLADYTFWLFCATLVLAVATVGLGWFAWRQSRDTKGSVAIAKRSADIAFVSSMPVLSPLVVPPNTSLHPLFKTPKFRSHVSFVFENFGKTPATIREVRADIFLCELDEFPQVNFDELPLIGYEPIIAGDSRGEKALMGVAECNRDFELSESEYTELLAEAKGRYRRMALIGRVVYDDFIGMRHTRNFCVKLRSMPGADGSTSLFQLVRGRDPYNRVIRQEIPK